jgi:transcriptional regulator with PAS, ATPase and Fis domain
MVKPEIFSQILDSLDDQIVLVDTNHIIQYMNIAARKHYAKFGDLIGKSILDCHNSHSCEIIRNTYPKLEKGSAEEFIYKTRKNRVYMRSVFDPEGKLIGYYERFEPLAGT